MKSVFLHTCVFSETAPGGAIKKKKYINGDGDETGVGKNKKIYKNSS